MTDHIRELSDQLELPERQEIFFHTYLHEPKGWLCRPEGSSDTPKPVMMWAACERVRELEKKVDGVPLRQSWHIAKIVYVAGLFSSKKEAEDFLKEAPSRMDRRVHRMWVDESCDGEGWAAYVEFGAVQRDDRGTHRRLVLRRRYKKLLARGLS